MEEWAGTSARRSRDAGGKVIYSVGSTSTVGTFTSSLVVSTSTLGSSTVSVVVPTSTSAVSTSKAGICPPSVFTSGRAVRSEEHTSELQSLMRISYAVFCLKKNNIKHKKSQIRNTSRLNLHTLVTTTRIT